MLLSRISEKAGKRNRSLADLIDFLFGWIYIGWVRRSLITASVFLVAVFVFPADSIIMRQINDLSRAN